METRLPSSLDPWGTIQSVLQHIGDSDFVRSAISAGGIPPSRQLTEQERYTHRTRIRAYLDIAACDYEQLDERKKRSCVLAIARYIIEKKPDQAEELRSMLGLIGWEITDSQLVPRDVLDPIDLAQVPDIAREDLIEAAKRLGEGDKEGMSGAITSACGAIDKVTERIYEDRNLGNVADASFQKRVNRSIEALGVYPSIERDLTNLGWESQRAKEFVKNLKGAVSQTAKVMETLRSKMGDPHGKKPTVDDLVFFSVRWAVIMCSLFKKGFQT